MNLDKKTIARTFAEIQHSLNYPGLVKECRELLISYGLGDKNPADFSKKSWKRMTRKTMRSKNEEYILQEAKKYKKIDYLEMKKEDFGVKDYIKKLNVSEARLRFRVKLQLVPGIKFSYKNTEKYKADMWSCPVCQMTGAYSLDSMSHTMWCPGLADFRKDRDMRLDKDIVLYMKDVLGLREKISMDSNVE